MADLAQARLTILGPELNVVRIVRMLHAPAFVLDDGSFLIAQQIHTPDRVGYPLHIADHDGRIVRSFGTDTPQYRGDLTRLMSRVVAPAHDGTIWAAPPAHYVIERWDPQSGNRIARLEVLSGSFRQSNAYHEAPGERPQPIIVGLFEDNDGLLWVLVRDADSDWTPPSASEAAIERAFSIEYYSGKHDFVLEVVDPLTGKVLATRRFDEYLDFRPPSRLLVSLKAVETSATVLQIWRPVLKPTGGDG